MDSYNRPSLSSRARGDSSVAQSKFKNLKARESYGVTLSSMPNAQELKGLLL